MAACRVERVTQRVEDLNDGVDGFRFILDDQCPVRDLQVMRRDAGNAGTSAVDRSRANVWGLSGLEGNVREWCSDDAPAQGSGTGLLSLRGGAWRDPPALRQVGTRLRLPPDASDSTTGFRVVLESKREPRP